MTPAGTWAIVPVKRFDRAKTRLAPVLSWAERKALAEAMLGDVLEALTRSGAFVGTLVVTSDAEAAAVGRRFATAVIDDPQDAGTNAAVVRGVRCLSRWGAGSVVVVPADLPFVTAAELRSVPDVLRDVPVAIVPATRDGGTNVLAMSPPDVIAPAFGCGSFDRHVAAAIAAGIDPALMRLEGGGRDIDVPADLDFAAGGGGGRRTRACIERCKFAASAEPAQTFEGISL